MVSETEWEWECGNVVDHEWQIVWIKLYLDTVKVLFETRSLVRVVVCRCGLRFDFLLEHVDDGVVLCFENRHCFIRLTSALRKVVLEVLTPA